CIHDWIDHHVAEKPVTPSSGGPAEQGRATQEQRNAKQTIAALRKENAPAPIRRRAALVVLPSPQPVAGLPSPTPSAHRPIHRGFLLHRSPTRDRDRWQSARAKARVRSLTR